APVRRHPAPAPGGGCSPFRSPPRRFAGVADAVPFAAGDCATGKLPEAHAHADALTKWLAHAEGGGAPFSDDPVERPRIACRRPPGRGVGRTSPAVAPAVLSRRAGRRAGSRRGYGAPPGRSARGGG